jgi:hypothetical protein
MICPFLADSDPALLATRRGSVRVAAAISPVMRAGPVWLLVPARLGPLPAGCSR